MNQNASVSKIRLHLVINKDLTIVSPQNPSITSKLTAPCSAMATVELIRGIEWVIISGMTVPYGLPLHGKGRSLKTAWDETIVEVTRRADDGTEEEFFS